KIDAEGYLVSDEGHRLTDALFGQEFLSSISLTESFTLKSNYKNLDIFVEAFDQPYMIRHLEKSDSKLIGELPYGLKVELDSKSLCIDEWDRFHGLATNGVPFVFSRAAQVEFFDFLTEFDDDSVQIDGITYQTPNYYLDKEEVNREKFWSDIYREEEPGWDLKAPASPLESIMAQLKLAKQRVLVLGCGRGHDAALFAKQGHIVTAVDFSGEAIAGAKELYGNLNIEWVEANVFELPSTLGKFDLIFEHTCYCAVSPTRRSELVRVWNKHLDENGHLLGIFFTMSKRVGPPYGGSEWELSKRLSPHFQNRYWTRWRHSLPRRQGKELVVYAQKITK
ncbi:MAG TPA: class I SAM-dependent methyltransferase, partial [Bdellovibrionales bacterium]|nr:class I SAM-dependent methyltransferase [Bdellovibrionales bacterium]